MQVFLDNMQNKYNLIAVIVAAGNGSRCLTNKPKQYLKLANNKIILNQTIEQFINDKIDKIVITINKDHIDLHNQKTIKNNKILPPIIGGKTRQESVKLALEGIRKFNPKYVIIHDAARPFVSKKIINNIIESLNINNGISTGIKIFDTIKKYENQKTINIDRENIYQIQTPQAFNYQELLQKHQKYQHLNFTDDISLYEYENLPIKIIDGSLDNFKITTTEDYYRAIDLFKLKYMKKNYRIGQGVDVHKFDNEVNENNFIILGGVKIPYQQKLLAHSDGDVLIHAIVDAILGALGLGDIGEAFPDNDPKNKNANSEIFLQFAKEKMKEMNGNIVNIDCTIICEKPKITPHKNEIRKNLARILEIEENQINIKATTTEKLGFTGRGEGIMAQVVCGIEVSGDE